MTFLMYLLAVLIGVAAGMGWYVSAIVLGGLWAVVIVCRAIELNKDDE